ncbi:MAG: elongation factor P [Nitrospiraceae bacterium]|nr:elongation factor P [Nitrospiraceae bacterium]
MISTADFRKGAKVEYKGEPFEIVDFQHSKVGRGGAVVRTKLRNMRTGAILDDTFRSGEKFDQPALEQRQMQYLYEQDGLHYFMDMESYEQTPLTRDQLGDAIKYLKDNMIVQLLTYKGDPMTVEVPMFVELTVSETEPSFRGDTASGSTKPAKMETGLVVRVPFHIQIGDVLKIDTRTDDYIEKVK